MTVFDGRQVKIEQEEIFGPVMSLTSWEDGPRKLHAVSETDYGAAPMYGQ